MDVDAHIPTKNNTSPKEKVSKDMLEKSIILLTSGLLAVAMTIACSSDDESTVKPLVEPVDKMEKAFPTDELSLIGQWMEVEKKPFVSEDGTGFSLDFISDNILSVWKSKDASYVRREMNYSLNDDWSYNQKGDTLSGSINGDVLGECAVLGMDCPYYCSLTGNEMILSLNPPEQWHIKNPFRYFVKVEREELGLVESAKGVIWLDTSLNLWYIVVHENGTIDSIIRYYPLHIDDSFKKENSKVHFSGMVHPMNISVSIPIGGLTCYRIDLKNIQIVNE